MTDIRNALKQNTVLLSAPTKKEFISLRKEFLNNGYKRLDRMELVKECGVRMYLQTVGRKVGNK